MEERNQSPSPCHKIFLKKPLEILCNVIKPVFPFFLIALFFGLLSEYGPNFIKKEAECAIYEFLAIKVAVLLFVSTTLTAGVFLFFMDFVRDDSFCFKKIIFRFFVREPSLFLSNIFWPMFGIGLGIASLAFFAGHKEKALELFCANIIHIALPAILNHSAYCITFESGLQLKTSQYIEQKIEKYFPRINQECKRRIPSIVIGIIFIIISCAYFKESFPMVSPDAKCSIQSG